MHLFAILVFPLLLLKLASAETICIVNSTVTNLTSLSINCQQVFESLNYINITLSSQIILYSGVFVLDRVLLFDTVSSLSIISQDEVIIRCVGQTSGIAFNRSQNIHLEGLIIDGCGGIFESTSTNLSDSVNLTTMAFRSALYFEKCTNVALFGVTVRNSNGVGVSMYNTNGNIQVLRSHFLFNMVPEKELNTFPGGGGFYIEFSQCNPGVLFDSCNLFSEKRENSVYTFKNCSFVSNIAQTINSKKGSFVKLIGGHSHNNQRLGRGGGLSLIFASRAKNNSVLISNCSFRNNSAISGGGLYSNLAGGASGVSISINGSTFSGNEASFSGGGIAYQVITNTVHDNSMIVHNCNVTNNNAENGGGLILLYNQLKASDNTRNRFLSYSTHFVGNLAKYGSAVDSILFAPSGYNGPHPVFKNCSFLLNKMSSTVLVDIDSSLSQSFYGTGTFTVAKMPITFNQSVIFENNIGTALWVVSSRLTFNSPMNANFVNNKGIEGGALGLVSFSVMYFWNDAIFKFVRNKAYHNGGAVYSFQYGKQQLLGAASQCPIQYLGNSSIDERNVSFYFEDNTLLKFPFNKLERGRSIYMTSIQPCVFLCTANPSAELTISNMFSCIGKVKFHSTKNVSITDEVSTSGRKFKLDNTSLSTLYLVPGKVFELPVVVSNDLGYPLINMGYHAQIRERRSKIIIDPGYISITEHRLKVYGPVGANGTIVFESSGHYRFVLKMSIELLPCPPGFYSDNLEHGKVISYPSCTCNWNSTSHSVYQGVSCNSAVFEAQVQHIYWIGYVSHYVVPHHIFTSLCPQKFCYGGQHISPLYTLPSNASYEELDKFVCGPNRQGLLCGECAEGHSVFYHSLHFKCKKNSLCHIGFLFYILSEILPLTVMFIVIVLLNINFSSGALNGFILFAQVLDSLSIGAYGMMEFQLLKSKSLYYITVLYRFIYRVFNLDFFTEDALSFCLWKGATTLDTLAFKFVTVFYAFLLVLVSILIVNKYKLNVRCCRQFRFTTIKSYIIHGLSAFLITCYIKCAQVSLNILIPGRLTGMAHEPSRHDPLKVVYFSGNIRYMSTEHLPYAFPALFVAFIVCVPPPFLLIWYPLGRQAVYKIVSKCRQFSYRLRHKSCHVSIIDKMKPLLDSFQSCYKDNCRYFAGLQFVYRLVILCTFNFTETPLMFYTVVEVEIILILIVHVIIWPYREKWHNIIDTLIYANIALVNGFTMFVYSSSVNFSTRFVYEAVVLQTALIYLPLVYIIAYTSVILYRIIKLKIVKKKERTMTSLDDGFPARLIENSYDTSYRLDDM
ncbi:uncharacterized protein LOC135347456 [Halichondria panicea]|uniref:uncharacterized protein LOC135347456 n=1 Tax=Halichondria panicea TaxID=6063 RepID=UPI00312B81C2